MTSQLNVARYKVGWILRGEEDSWEWENYHYDDLSGAIEHARGVHRCNPDYDVVVYDELDEAADGCLVFEIEARSLAATGTERGKAGARGAIARLSLDEAWRDAKAAAAEKLARAASRVKWQTNEPEGTK